MSLAVPDSLLYPNRRTVLQSGRVPGTSRGAPTALDLASSPPGWTALPLPARQPSGSTLDPHRKEPPPCAWSGPKTQTQQLLRYRQGVERSQDTLDALTFELEQVHAFEFRSAAGWRIPRRVQQGKMRAADSPLDCAATSIPRDADWREHLIPEIRKGAEHGFGKDPHCCSPAGRRVWHCRVVPLDVIRQAVHEGFEITCLPRRCQSLDYALGSGHVHGQLPATSLACSVFAQCCSSAAASSPAAPRVRSNLFIPFVRVHASLNRVVASLCCPSTLPPYPCRPARNPGAAR